MALLTNTLVYKIHRNFKQKHKKSAITPFGNGA